MVVYPHEKNFKGRLAILTIREHLCGYYEQKVECIDSRTVVDASTGHTVCCGCKRITVKSGFRNCDICEREYINKDQYEDPKYETICPECVKTYGV